MARSAVQFKHVYAGLLAGALASALALPPDVGARLRGIAAPLFRPVAGPLHATAGAVAGFAEQRRDPAAAGKSADAVRIENERLRLEVANLEGRLKAMAALARERQRLGPIAELCRPARVTGTAPGVGDGLLIAGRFDRGLPVLYSGGLAGRTDGPGAVRLLTDDGFKFEAGFARYAPAADSGGPEFQPLPTPTPVVRGAGGGAMVIDRMVAEDLQKAGVRPGDWVLLDDPDWSADLRNYRVGTVKSIDPIPASPGFVRVAIAPPQDLAALREVMVFVGE